MRSFPLRIPFALAFAAVLFRGMTWLDQERERLFGGGWSFPLLLLTWLLIVPLFAISSRVSTGLCRIDAKFEERGGDVMPITSPYRARALLLTALLATLCFLVNFVAITAQPFLSPWMVAISTSMLVPLLLPTCRVGVAWVEPEVLRILWEDRATFRLPFRSLDSVEQLVVFSDFPFERFGQGAWTPLVLSERDERRLEQALERSKRSAASGIRSQNG